MVKGTAYKTPPAPDAPGNKEGWLRGRPGFTFIEAAMTISIIAILCMIAYPAATNYVKKTRDAALKKDLFVLRESVDKFYAAYSRYPKSLDELVEKSFIRAIPIDPVTNSYQSWKMIPSKEGERDVFNVKSGAEGSDGEGIAYENY